MWSSALGDDEARIRVATHPTPSLVTSMNMNTNDGQTGHSRYNFQHWCSCLRSKCGGLDWTGPTTREGSAPGRDVFEPPLKGRSGYGNPWYSQRLQCTTTTRTTTRTASTSILTKLPSASTITTPPGSRLQFENQNTSGMKSIASVEFAPFHWLLSFNTRPSGSLPMQHGCAI